MAAARRRQRRRTTRTRPAPRWVWSLAGLLAGLLVAFLVFLQMRPKPAAQVAQPLAVPTPKPAPKPAPRPKPKAAATPQKPHFDFYTLLPEMEVVVPDEQIKGKPTQEGVKEVKQPGTYLLQAASFRSAKQAEQLRARLALLGLETSVQTVSVDNRETWHRVRVGPFSNLKELNDARGLLKKNGVDAILIRLKG